MKSEPDVFSFEDLKNCPKKTEPWDGVRNYQARNFMRDDMKKGDVVFFYHSNCKEPGIVGLAEIVSKAAYPDVTQFDKKSKYYDPKSDPENPRWLVVDVRYKKRLKHPVSLKDIKAHKILKDMKVAQRGMRLSVQPVEEKHAKIVLELGG
ncbi:MAG: EVE domain-containing protein [Puniceicoccaceae bacterium]